LTQVKLSPTRALGSPFDPSHCILERDPEKIREYLRVVETALGHRARIVAVLEIGSFAKGEAVPSSDIDTRVYATSPEAYLINPVPGAERQTSIDGALARRHGVLPRRDFAWDDLNEPVGQDLSATLGVTVEFFVVDLRCAEYELHNLQCTPSIEHSLLLQSNILYDPHGFLIGKVDEIHGKMYEPMVGFYKERFLQGVTRNLGRYIGPHPWDQNKLHASGQIQWVQQAVRALRNAVAAKMYASTGQFLYKKPDVLAFYGERLPLHYPFVEELYRWKCDPLIRQEMVERFSSEPAGLYEIFAELTPQVGAIVDEVRELDLLASD
jgi:hypothetical protein